ncbi:MAG TPA: glycosyltransferase family 39 protein [Tepidisphaeraceae bacterium]
MPLRHHLIVFVYGAIVFLLFLDNGTTLTRHEVLAAEPAREMLDAGAPLAVQTFAGEVRTAKPPTMSWLIAAAMQLTQSRGEFACRLPAALSAILVAHTVAVIAHRLLGSPAGLLAGLATLTTFWLQLQGRLAQADVPMTAAITVAMAALTWLLPRRAGGSLLSAPGPAHSQTLTPRALRLIAVVFYAGTGASFLIKGVGPLVTLPAAVLFGLWSRDRRVWKVLLDPLGLAVLAVLLLAWPIAALMTYPPIWRAWLDQTVGRLDGQFDKRDPVTPLGYALGLPFYLYTAPMLLLPMTPALVLAAWHVRRRWRESMAVRFLICWVAPFFVLITLSAFRNPHYVMPLMPAASVGAALGTLVWARGLRRPQWARPLLTIWFVACLIGALVVQAVIGPRSDSFRVYARLAAVANLHATGGGPVRLIGLGEAQVAYYLSTIPVRIDDPARTPRDTLLLAICDRQTLHKLAGVHAVTELATARRPRDDDNEELVLVRLNAGPESTAVTKQAGGYGMTPGGGP